MIDHQRSIVNDRWIKRRYSGTIFIALKGRNSGQLFFYIRFTFSIRIFDPQSSIINDRSSMTDELNVVIQGQFLLLLKGWNSSQFLSVFYSYLRSSMIINDPVWDRQWWIIDRQWSIINDRSSMSDEFIDVIIVRASHTLTML